MRLDSKMLPNSQLSVARFLFSSLFLCFLGPFNTPPGVAALEGCEAVQCSDPPQNLTCNKGHIGDLKFNEKYEQLTARSCCPKWVCSFNDNKIVLDGISSKELQLNSTTCPNSIGIEHKNCHADSDLDPDFEKLVTPLAECCPVINCKNDQADSEHTAWSSRFFITAPSNPDKEEALLATNNTACPERSCKADPSIQADYECSQGDSASMSSAEFSMLGQEKECCPLWECKKPDGASYKTFETSGESGWYFYTEHTRKDPDHQNTHSCRNINCPNVDISKKRCMFAPPQTGTSGGELYVGNNSICCPVSICNSMDKTHAEITYAIIGGETPKADDAPNCNTALCGSPPIVEGHTCKIHQITEPNEHDHNHVVLSSLGGWKNCCPVWECSNADETHVYIELRITTPKFWSYVEINQQHTHKLDIKEDDDDDDDSSTSKPGEAGNSTAPLKAIATATAKPSTSSSSSSSSSKKSEKITWNIKVIKDPLSKVINWFTQWFKPPSTVLRKGENSGEKGKKKRKKWWQQLFQ